MAFLDSLGKKISQTSQDVVQKTKDTAEIMKFTSMVSDEERHIDHVYTQLGKLYFELYSSAPEGAFADMITEIKQAQEKITEYNENIKKIKGISYCPNCNAELPISAAFCSTCGFKLEKEESIIPNEKTPQRFCPTCGTPMPDGYLFCINCGEKYTEDIDAAPAAEPIFEGDATPDIQTSENITE